MSSSLVTCPNCKETFDICNYDPKDVWRAKPISKKPYPWKCENCEMYISFNDKERPWLGLRADKEQQ